MYEKAYVTLVKSLIDAGSDSDSDDCAAVEADVDYCGDGVDSYYAEFEYGDYRVIITNGMPDHEAEHDAISSSRLQRCELIQVSYIYNVDGQFPSLIFLASGQRWQYVTLPTSPSNRNISIGLPLGAAGWATSGAVFYDHRSDNTGGTARYNEGDTFDSCNGHSSGAKEYHYHMVRP